MVKEALNIAYGSYPYQQMDVYFPHGYNESAPVAFLIHGGGFIAGQKDDFTMQAKLMRDEGFVTVNLSHRLVDTTGLFRNPPLHRPGSVKITDQLADVDAAVARYIASAAAWGSGTGRMYMAGHSAGAILAMLYVQGDQNKEGRVRASGNWAGATDLSLPGESAYHFLLEQQRAQINELYYRAAGFPPATANNPAFKAISPYWVAELNGGRPNISIYPEDNFIFSFPAEAIYGLANTRKFHALLHSRGIAEQLSVYAGSNHGFSIPVDAWQRCIHETAVFFQAQ